MFSLEHLYVSGAPGRDGDTPLGQKVTSGHLTREDQLRQGTCRTAPFTVVVVVCKISIFLI